MRHLPFQLQKLLTNPPIPLDHNRAEATIRRKSVLVTGAGGSIASSLCRRIKQFGPKTLILLEQSENNLYQIDLDLSADQSGVRLVPVLGDAGDLGLLDNVFDAYQPDLIFHTAAYKHVPLLELQPLAAIRNNVIGTYNLINNAIRHRVPRLIMLSTDKAVNPASIMGVSKRVAELMMLALSSPQCRLTSVRLGNVLGTQGSVVPRFEEQIRRREPVTVTHPDAARFFMTADGAVELVLAAAWLGTGGDILVPDLGEPIRIIDLANTMIDAAGLDPGCQPSITFTGLRPGEKIREELFTDAEQDFPDALSNVTRVTAPAMPGSQVHTLIGEISDLAAASDLRNLIAKLREIVPEYQPNDVLTGILPCLAVT